MEKLKIRYVNLVRIHWKKIIFALCVFCFFSASSMQGISSFYGTLGDFILISITDKHYLIFCLLPIYIWFLFSTFSRQSSLATIRYRACYICFLSELIPIVIFTSLLVLGPVVCSAIIGLVAGFPISSQLSHELMESFYGDVLKLYLGQFHSYTLSIIATILYLFAGLCFLAILLKYMCYPLSSKVVLIITILFYISALYAIQRGIDVYVPYLFFSSYLFLAQALVGKCAWLCSIVMIIVSVVCVLLVKKRVGCKNFE